MVLSVSFKCCEFQLVHVYLMEISGFLEKAYEVMGDEG